MLRLFKLLKLLRLFRFARLLQRRFTESTVLCYALDDEAGGADACERAVQASIERMGHREAGRAAKRHRR